MSIIYTSYLHKKTINKLVVEYERDKEERRKKQRRGFLLHGDITMKVCTQCKRGMSPILAKQQLENDREDAPICIPCIMGYKRKPVSTEVEEKLKARFERQSKKQSHDKKRNKHII